MPKYNKFELMNWCGMSREKFDLSPRAHHLSLVLATMYIDEGAKAQYPAWGVVRVYQKQLMTLTGIKSKRTLSAMSKELHDKKVWKYKPGRQDGSPSEYKPIMEMPETASKPHLLGVVHDPVSVHDDSEPFEDPFELPLDRPYETAPSRSVPSEYVPVKHDSAPTEDPFGFSILDDRESPPSRSVRDAYVPEKHDGLLLEWSHIHNQRSSIFPFTWRKDVKNESGQTVRGVDSFVPADQQKIIQDIAVLRGNGWNSEQLRKFFADFPLPGKLRKDYVAYIRYLIKSHALKESPDSYTPAQKRRTA